MFEIRVFLLNQQINFQLNNQGIMMDPKPHFVILVRLAGQAKDKISPTDPKQPTRVLPCEDYLQ